MYKSFPLGAVPALRIGAPKRQLMKCKRSISSPPGGHANGVYTWRTSPLLAENCGNPAFPSECQGIFYSTCFIPSCVAVKPFFS